MKGTCPHMRRYQLFSQGYQVYVLEAFQAHAIEGRFKVKGEHRCDIYGDLIPASRGQPGASKRDKRCIAAEVK